MSDPTLSGAQSFDALSARLNSLRTAAGAPSYSEIARRVGTLREKRGVRAAAATPGRVTVYDTFRAGRSRMDIELVADIVSALGFVAEVPQWRRAHEAIMRQQAQERYGRTSATRARVARVDLPGQLQLVGRDQQVQQAVDFLAKPKEQDAPRGVFVTGMPGVGKSSVARAVVSRIAASRTGSLVIEVALRTNVGGITPHEADPAEVIENINRSRAERLDDGPLVVLLDDVFSADDLMLIGSSLPDDAVLVATSRRSLEMPDTILTVLLEPLPTADAVRLLTNKVRADPAFEALLETGDLAQSPAWSELAELCGGLPLALVLLAAQITAHQGWSLDDHVERLEYSSSSALVPTLTVAYNELSPAVRRTLHLLSCHPGRLTQTEAKVYVGTVGSQNTDAVDGTLRELERERFIEVQSDGRYDLHDVVRAMAAQRAIVAEPLSSRRRAAARLADYLCASLDALPQDADGLERFIAQAEVCVTSVQLASECRASESLLALVDATEWWLEFAQRWQDIILVLEAVRPVLTGDEVVDLDIRLADMLLIAGRIADAEVLLLRLTTDPTFVEKRYRAYGRLGWAAALRGDISLALNTTSSALDGAVRDGNSIGIQVLTSQYAEALCDSGQPNEAITLLQDLLDGPSDIGPERRAHLLGDLAMAAISADRSELAHQASADAKAAAASITHLGLMAYADSWHGIMLMHDGDAAGAVAVLTDVDERLKPERANVRAATKVQLAKALLHAGDVAGAKAVVVEALALTQEHRFRVDAHFGRIVLSGAHLANGR